MNLTWILISINSLKKYIECDDCTISFSSRMDDTLLSHILSTNTDKPELYNALREAVIEVGVKNSDSEKATYLKKLVTNLNEYISYTINTFKLDDYKITVEEECSAIERCKRNGMKDVIKQIKILQIENNNTGELETFVVNAPAQLISDKSWLMPLLFMEHPLLDIHNSNIIQEDNNFAEILLGYAKNLFKIRSLIMNRHDALIELFPTESISNRKVAPLHWTKLEAPIFDYIDLVSDFANWIAEYDIHTRSVSHGQNEEILRSAAKELGVVIFYSLFNICKQLRDENLSDAQQKLIADFLLWYEKAKSTNFTSEVFLSPKLKQYPIHDETHHIPDSIQVLSRLIAENAVKDDLALQFNQVVSLVSKFANYVRLMFRDDEIDNFYQLFVKSIQSQSPKIFFSNAFRDTANNLENFLQITDKCTDEAQYCTLQICQWHTLNYWQAFQNLHDDAFLYSLKTALYYVLSQCKSGAKETVKLIGVPLPKYHSVISGQILQAKTTIFLNYYSYIVDEINCERELWNALTTSISKYSDAFVVSGSLPNVFNSSQKSMLLIYDILAQAAKSLNANDYKAIKSFHKFIIENAEDIKDAEISSDNTHAFSIMCRLLQSKYKFEDLIEIYSIFHDYSIKSSENYDGYCFTRDKTEALVLVENNGLALGSEELVKFLNDKDIILTAIKNNKLSVQYVPETLQEMANDWINNNNNQADNIFMDHSEKDQIFDPIFESRIDQCLIEKNPLTAEICILDACSEFGVDCILLNNFTA